MRDLLNTLADVSRRLDALAIPFMLTGSMAQNYYAIERMTADIDLVMELKPEDVPRFLAEFQRDFYVSGESVLLAVRNASPFNLIHLESIIKVDCVIKTTSEYA